MKNVLIYIVLALLTLVGCNCHKKGNCDLGEERRNQYRECIQRARFFDNTDYSETDSLCEKHAMDFATCGEPNQFTEESINDF